MPPASRTAPCPATPNDSGSLGIAVVRSLGWPQIATLIVLLLTLSGWIMRTEVRISQSETRQEAMIRSLERIEDKLDRVYQRQ